MKNMTTNKFQLSLIALMFVLGTAPTFAQNASVGQSGNNTVKTDSRILYHNGPVRTGGQNVYFIFYGCWTSPCANLDDSTAINILEEFSATVGNSPYLGINSTYTDRIGNAASHSLVYAGQVFDSSYAHGSELTKSDIEAIISDQFLGFGLPADPQGIYVVVASADISSTATGFCVPGAPPFHSSAIIVGGLETYIFLGHPNRCPAIAGPQFGNQPTPNANFAADALVTNFAHAANGLLTNPYGTGWYDRNGLENADKCTGNFGTTYTTPNGARANVHLGGQRDYLLETNWINNRKGSCVLLP